MERERDEKIENEIQKEKQEAKSNPNAINSFFLRYRLIFFFSYLGFETILKQFCLSLNNQNVNIIHLA